MVPTDACLADYAAAGEGNHGFDLIYIDGDHSSEGVLLDGMLAWDLLRSVCCYSRDRELRIALLPSLHTKPLTSNSHLLDMNPSQDLAA